MADGFDTLLTLLPEELRRGLSRLPTDVKAQVQELRLRAGQAVCVGIRGREHYVTADGAFTDYAGGALHCTTVWLRQTVDRACEQSVYAHQEELRHGFLPAPVGCRIGVAGTAVLEQGRIVSYRNVTSLCLRVAREHYGCAYELAERLCGDGIHGALIGGEPSSGKTSLLRDLLREFAGRRISAVAVDERGELTGGTPINCDVLRGTPKAQGITQAIRCLAPRVIVFDELGNTEELQAVHGALTCGVPVVASVHCRRPQELLRREGMTEALRSGAFAYMVQLRGCACPGEIADVIRTEEWLSEAVWNTADPDGGDRLGHYSGA